MVHRSLDQYSEKSLRNTLIKKSLRNTLMGDSTKFIFMILNNVSSLSYTAWRTKKHCSITHPISLFTIHACMFRYRVTICSFPKTHSISATCIIILAVVYLSQVPGPLHLSLGLDLLLVVGFPSLVLMITELFFMEDGMVNVVAELAASTSLTSKQW